jgi:hypothetical protein
MPKLVWLSRTALELAFRTRFVSERGSLITDDTVTPKPFAPAIEGLACVYSSQERPAVYGFFWRLALHRIVAVWPGVYRPRRPFSGNAYATT